MYCKCKWFFLRRYLAHGGSLETLAFSYRIGSSTAAKIIFETCAALWDVLKGEYLSPPTLEQWKEIAAEFEKRWNFPLCLGAVDGKHIAIRVSSI